MYVHANVLVLTYTYACLIYLAGICIYIHIIYIYGHFA